MFLPKNKDWMSQLFEKPANGCWNFLKTLSTEFWSFFKKPLTGCWDCVKASVKGCWNCLKRCFRLFKRSSNSTEDTELLPTYYSRHQRRTRRYLNHYTVGESSESEDYSASPIVKNPRGPQTTS